jgi:thiol-disulfide isomerase/thioredoxin
MIRKILLSFGLLAVALGGTVGALYVLNAAPAVPAVSAVEAADSARPYVVKLHAQWCPYCLLTKDEWTRIEETYAGRVNLVVFDFTTASATERSRTVAQRFGLTPFFDEYAGATGMVVVLDGRTKNVIAEVGGSRPFEEYRAAIDAALAVPQMASLRRQ